MARGQGQDTLRVPFVSGWVAGYGGVVEESQEGAVVRHTPGQAAVEIGCQGAASAALRRRCGDVQGRQRSRSHIFVSELRSVIMVVEDADSSCAVTPVHRRDVGDALRLHPLVF